MGHTPERLSANSSSLSGGTVGLSILRLRLHLHRDCTGSPLTSPYIHMSIWVSKAYKVFDTGR